MIKKLLQRPTDNVDPVLIRDFLKKHPQAFSKREKDILRARFIDRETFIAIAKKFNITPVRARQTAIFALYKIEHGDILD